MVGEFARTPRYQGAGSSQVNPTRVDVPLDELRAGVPDGVDVVFAPGFTIEPDPSTAAALADQAVAVAAGADVVVAFLGLQQYGGGGGVRPAHLLVQFVAGGSSPSTIAASSSTR